MKSYSQDEVKRFLDIYSKMIFYHENHQSGAMAPKTISLGKDIITKAKTQFPEELKDDKFNRYLRGLENIVQGRLYNINKTFPKHCDAH